VVLTTVLLFLVAGGGLAKLKISTDFRVYLGDDNHDVTNLEVMEDKFTKNETLFLTLVPKQGTVFTPEVISAVHELTDKAWQTPYSRRVDSITNFQYSVSADNEISVGDLIPKDKAYAANELAKIKEIAINEPFLKNSLISEDGSSTAVQVTLHLSDDLSERMNQTPESVRYIRGLVDDLKASHPEIDFYLAGSVMMNQVMGEAAVRDIINLVPLCYIVITILMFLLLRNTLGVALTLGIVSITNVMVLGLSGWLEHILAPVIGFVPNAILIIAVADCIHILATYYLELSNGKSKEEAVKNSLTINFSAVFITSLATVIGFLCLNFNEAPPYRDLGNMVALGAFIAWALSISFLPAVLALLPASKKAQRPLMVSSMTSLGAHVIRNHRGYLVVSILVSLFLTFSLFKNELNDNWNEYFDESFDLRVAVDAIDENITGVHRIDYAIAAPADSGVSNPEYLEFVEKFSAWYKMQPGVAYVSNVSDTFKRLNKNMHSDDQNYYKLPDDEVLAAQYLLFYEMSLPFGLDLNNQVSFDKDSSRITVMLHRTTSEQVLDLKDEATIWLNANTPQNLMVSEATGIDVAFANIARSNTFSMLWGTALAFALISITLAITTKSARYGALSLVPSISPPLCAFGVWALTVSQSGHATSAVVCMAIGIIVDDTVHFMSKYRYALDRLKLSPREAVQYSFSTVGVAIVITSIILVAGFLVMGLSPFQPTSQMGNLLAITITMALIFDLFMLPALLIHLDERKQRSAPFSSLVAIKD